MAAVIETAHSHGGVGITWALEAGIDGEIVVDRKEAGTCNMRSK